MCSESGVQEQKSSIQRLRNIFVAGVIYSEQKNTLQADLMTVCDFLIEQFEVLNTSHGTILTHLHCPLLLPVDGYSVGEHH